MSVSSDTQTTFVPPSRSSSWSAIIQVSDICRRSGGPRMRWGYRRVGSSHMMVSCVIDGGCQGVGCMSWLTVLLHGPGCTRFRMRLTWTTLVDLPFAISRVLFSRSLEIVHPPSHLRSSFLAVGQDNHTESPTAKCRGRAPWSSATSVCEQHPRSGSPQGHETLQDDSWGLPDKTTAQMQ